jgi:bacteriophage CI repressor helix-turn-helix domain
LVYAGYVATRKRENESESEVTTVIEILNPDVLRMAKANLGIDTNSDLADFLGVSVNTLANWRNGVGRGPSIGHLARLHRATGLELSDMVTTREKTKAA